MSFRGTSVRPLKAVGEDTVQTGEVLPPNRYDPAKYFRKRTGPAPQYETAAALEAAITNYIESLQNDDASWNRPPTLSGAGLELGFSSPSWYERYAAKEETRDVIQRFRMFCRSWLEQQALVPSKGVHANGTMFMLNRLWSKEDMAGGDQPDGSPQGTPENVKRVLTGLKLGKQIREGGENG